MSNIIYKNLISPLGFSLKESFAEICAGKSGLRVNENLSFKEKTFTAVVDEQQLDEAFAEESIPKKYSKLEKLSILLIKQALEVTAVDPTSDRTLLIYATTKGNISLADPRYKYVSQERLLLSNFKSVIQKYFGFKRAPIIVSSACVSGTQAIILANHFVRRGLYDNVLVVGGDIVSYFTLSGFHNLNALSKYRCRPFDKYRDGINIGECCAIIVLSCHSKDGMPYSVLSGASTSDAHHLVAPSREGVGLTMAIKRCLAKQPNIPVDFISAHGTATRYNDEMEALSIYNNGLANVPTFSAKGYFGHTLGAAGVLETVISLQAIDSEVLIPSLGYTESGVSCSINVTSQLKRMKIKSFLKTSSGFGGVNAALLIGTSNG